MNCAETLDLGGEKRTAHVRVDSKFISFHFVAEIAVGGGVRMIPFVLQTVVGLNSEHTTVVREYSRQSG